MTDAPIIKPVDPQVAAAYVAGAAGLVGVVTGSLGTLLAGRSASKAAHRTAMLALQSEQDQQTKEQRRNIYAAMIERLDWRLLSFRVVHQRMTARFSAEMEKWLDENIKIQAPTESYGRVKSRFDTVASQGAAEQLEHVEATAFEFIAAKDDLLAIQDRNASRHGMLGTRAERAAEVQEASAARARVDAALEKHTEEVRSFKRLITEDLARVDVASAELFISASWARRIGYWALSKLRRRAD